MYNKKIHRGFIKTTINEFLNQENVSKSIPKSKSDIKHNMFFNDLSAIYDYVCEILDMDNNSIYQLLSNGHNWALYHIATANNQLGSVYHFLKETKQTYTYTTITENNGINNYMFFQNLKSLKNKSNFILNLDKHIIDNMLSDTDIDNEWIINLITRTYDDVDEVYSFLSSIINTNYDKWSDPMKLKSDRPISDELQYHLDNNIALGESVFRYGSEKFIDLVNEVKTLYSKNLIQLNENDTFIVEDFANEYFKIGEDKLITNLIYEDIKTLNETQYKGKDIELNKPKRGGSKKFYVYVKDPKNNKIKKVSFGAKSGGGKLSVKLKDPKARKAFADRHRCEEKNDKTKPGYWACRLPRYAKLLGLSGGGKWW